MDPVLQTPPGQTPPTPPPPPPEKKTSKKILIIGAILLILLLILGIGGYFLNERYQASLLPPVVTPKSSPTPSPTQTTSPSADMTNWKTYDDNEFGFSFKYPQSFKLNKYTENSLPKVILEKGIKICKGCGFANTDETQEGIQISIVVLPYEKLPQEGSTTTQDAEITTKKIVINGKEGIEKIINHKYPNQYLKNVLFNLKNNVLSISLGQGFDTSSNELDSYIKDFEQILSTFQFNP